MLSHPLSLKQSARGRASTPVLESAEEQEHRTMVTSGYGATGRERGRSKKQRRDRSAALHLSAAAPESDERRRVKDLHFLFFFSLSPAAVAMRRRPPRQPPPRLVPFLLVAATLLSALGARLSQAQPQALVSGEEERERERGREDIIPFLSFSFFFFIPFARFLVARGVSPFRSPKLKKKLSLLSPGP